MIVVKDTHGAVFGGLYTSKLEFKQIFTGTGESFLWRLRDGTIDVFKATMKNSLFCFADEYGFGMGSQ